MFKKAKIKNSVLWIMGNLSTEKFKFNSLYSFLRSIKHLFFVGCRTDCITSSLKYNFTLDAILNRKRIIVKYVDRERTVAGYKASDVFFFPSNIEGSPIVIFESLICGVPFIATEVGNTKEIVEWTKGGVILPTVIDEKGISRAVIEESIPILEKVVNDKEYRLFLGRQGKEAVIAKYTWEKIAKEYEELLLNVTEDN
jgi:glycosyltransferase involved in cell wall biosynthesis